MTVLDPRPYTLRPASGDGLVRHPQPISIVLEDGTDLLDGLPTTGEGAPIQAELHDDFTGKGTTSLLVADSGQTYIKEQTTQGALSIINGRLTNTATTGVQAGYAQTELSANVARIGAEFGFGPGADGGGINIAIWKTSIESFPTIPDSPLHITVTPTSYGITTFTSGIVEEVLPAQFFTRPLSQNGTLYTVEAYIEPEGIYVLRPDGLIDGPYTSPEVVANAGRFTNHEIYNNNAATETKGSFARIWADIRSAA